MVFTQCSILNRDSHDVAENRSPFVRQKTERIELDLGRERPFWGFSTDLGLSTAFKRLYVSNWIFLWGHLPDAESEEL